MEGIIMPKKIYAYTGTYTQPIRFGTGQILHGKGKGIYRFLFNPETGVLKQDGEVTEAINPSYLTMDKRRRFLYAVNELKEYQGQACGSVSAYRVDPDTHDLALLNTQPTGGTDPCHVIVNKENTHVFVSNFMSGSVCVFPIAKDGSLEQASCFIQHSGSSVNQARQSSPHAHSLIFDEHEQRAFVPDLGIDKVMIYQTDFVGGKLLPNGIPFFKARPGAGPRHCVFGRDFRHCYLINELDSSISVLAYDSCDGSFRELQKVPTVPDDSAPGNTCADVHISPDGRFLYGSNRGHNSIIVYAADQGSGRLSYVDTTPSGGEIPRNFTIDPTGSYALVCNQDSDNIVVFRIDNETGRLAKVSETAVPTPVCIKTYWL
jgi:6-phosphogluconolactonase